MKAQAFKIGECLLPFYLAAREFPDEFKTLPLSNEILLQDTEKFFRLLQKDKFFPSPYSSIQGGGDQYTDFAAFTIDFCSLAYDYWSKVKQNKATNVVETAVALAHAALDFLTAPEHRLADDRGVRWAGTNKYVRTKKSKEFFTDTYFTSLVILALNRQIDHPVLALSRTRKDEIRNLIREASKWISDRFDGEYITGDESKTNRRILYTTWGLRALVENHGSLDANLRKVIAPITSAYLTAVHAMLNSTDLNQRHYVTILSEDVNNPLWYEDRADLAGVFLTLIKLRTLFDLERLLEESDYQLLCERILTELMGLQNTSSGLWYRSGLILSFHQFLVEAFLLLSRHGSMGGAKLEVSSHIIRTAVRDALEDESLNSAIQQSVYQRVLQLVESISRERQVKREMSTIPQSPATKATAAKEGRPNNSRHNRRRGSK